MSARFAGVGRGDDRPEWNMGCDRGGSFYNAAEAASFLLG
jgi:hypothetical protein